MPALTANQPATVSIGALGEQNPLSARSKQGILKESTVVKEGPGIRPSTLKWNEINLSSKIGGTSLLKTGLNGTIGSTHMQQDILVGEEYEKVYSFMYAEIEGYKTKIKKINGFNDTMLKNIKAVAYQ